MSQKLATFLHIIPPLSIFFVLVDHCKDMSISGSRHIDRKEAAIIIIEVEFDSKTDGLLRDKRNFHFDLFFSYA